MEILYLDEVDSTQKFLIQKLRDKEVIKEVAISAEIQTDGIGSRENSWVSQRGNLFLSFIKNIDNLPDDLPLASISIYFGYILKLTLNNLGSEVFLKWSNDIYLDDKKIGGLISNKIGNKIICGIGLNLLSSPKGFKKLDIDVSKEKLLKLFFKNIDKKILWNDIFKSYKLDFEKSKELSFTHNEKKISLKDAELNSDGSITLNNEIIYSFR